MAQMKPSGSRAMAAATTGGVHGEFLFATQAWFHKSSIAADIQGF